MNKEWMTKSRVGKEYQKGLRTFVDFAFKNASINGMILCPCKKCNVGICVTEKEVIDHLTVDGFIPGYTHWIAHGELACSGSSSLQSQCDYPTTSNSVNDM